MSGPGAIRSFTNEIACRISEGRKEGTVVDGMGRVESCE